MKLYDTAQNDILELTPVDGEVFRFYCCGPTVYGPAHIGNFRTFVIQDAFRRTLEIGGVPTKHVRNLTDVDDKTIKGAIASNQDLTAYTDLWTDRFHRDCEALNCLPPHVEPSAVAHIPQQIEMIQVLIDKGHAYAAKDNSVYFKISSYEDYGKLSKLDQRELDLGKTQNERVSDADEYEKDSVSDFVLWKAYKEEDGPYHWDSQWGNGRPGWHIECSAMSLEHLGNTFDLHSGGVDLIFPHHENEIAQSKCSYGGDFARHWFHVTHLLVEGEKMAKSKGNFFTLGDLEEKGFTAAEVRFVLMGAHYRKPLNFTISSLQAAREALAKLSKAMFEMKRDYQLSDYHYEDCLATSDFGLFQTAWDVLQYDLNTQAAVGKMFAQLKRLNNLSEDDALITWKGWNALVHALGIEVPEFIEEKAIIAPSNIQDLAVQRSEAKSNKDWAKADAIRDELKSLGWEVLDTKDGFSFKKI